MKSNAKPEPTKMEQLETLLADMRAADPTVSLAETQAFFSSEACATFETKVMALRFGAVPGSAPEKALSNILATITMAKRVAASPAVQAQLAPSPAIPPTITAAQPDG
jgi:hypothetical protein